MEVEQLLVLMLAACAASAYVLHKRDAQNEPLGGMELGLASSFNDGSQSFSSDGSLDILSRLRRSSDPYEFYKTPYVPSGYDDAYDSAGPYGGISASDPRMRSSFYGSPSSEKAKQARKLRRWKLRMKARKNEKARKNKKAKKNQKAKKAGSKLLADAVLSGPYDGGYDSDPYSDAPYPTGYTDTYSNDPYPDPYHEDPSDSDDTESDDSDPDSNDPDQNGFLTDGSYINDPAYSDSYQGEAYNEGSYAGDNGGYPSYSNMADMMEELGRGRRDVRSRWGNRRKSA